MLVWNEYIVDETKQPEGENYYKYTIETLQTVGRMTLEVNGDDFSEAPRTAVPSVPGEEISTEVQTT